MNNGSRAAVWIASLVFVAAISSSITWRLLQKTETAGSAAWEKLPVLYRNDLENGFSSEDRRQLASCTDQFAQQLSRRLGQSWVGKRYRTSGDIEKISASKAGPVLQLREPPMQGAIVDWTVYAQMRDEDAARLGLLKIGSFQGVDGIVRGVTIYPSGREVLLGIDLDQVQFR